MFNEPPELALTISNFSQNTYYFLDPQMYRRAFIQLDSVIRNIVFQFPDVLGTLCALLQWFVFKLWRQITVEKYRAFQLHLGIDRKWFVLHNQLIAMKVHPYIRRLRKCDLYLCQIIARANSRSLWTLSWWGPLSYRNQSIALQSKSYRNQSIALQSKLMDWFLYDNGLRHERVIQTRWACFKVWKYK